MFKKFAEAIIGGVSNVMLLTYLYNGKYLDDDFGLGGIIVGHASMPLQLEDLRVLPPWQTIQML